MLLSFHRPKGFIKGLVTDTDTNNEAITSNVPWKSLQQRRGWPGKRWILLSTLHIMTGYSVQGIAKTV
jgi:hypothetical protein